MFYEVQLSSKVGSHDGVYSIAEDSEALYQSNHIDMAQKVTTAAAHLGFQILAGSGRNSVPVVNLHPCCVLFLIRRRGL